MSGFDNYSRLAKTIGNYQGAEDVAFAVLSPLINNLNDIFTVYALPIVLVVLMGYSIRLQPRAAGLYLLQVFAVALALGVTVQVPVSSALQKARPGNFVEAVARAHEQSSGISIGSCGGGDGCMTQPFLFFAVNTATTAGMHIVMQMVDVTPLGGAGKPGNFAASFLSGTVDVNDYAAKLQGTDLHRAILLYRRACADIRSGTRDPLTPQQMVAAGLRDGVPGVAGDAELAERDRALAVLAKHPANGMWNEYGVDQYVRFKLLDRAYWVGFLADGKRPGSYLIAPEQLRYVSATGDAEISAMADPQDFSPKNCAQLYQTIQVGMAEFKPGVDAAIAKTRAARGVDSSYDSQGVVNAAALATSIYRLQAAVGDTADDGWIPGPIKKVIGWFTGGVETAAVGAIAKLIQFIADFLGKYYVLLLPGIIALVLATALAVFPIVCLFSLFPGRLSMLSSFFWLVVYLKTVLVMTYLLIKIGSFIGLAIASAAVQTNDYSAIEGLSLATNIGTLIVAMIGGPLAARALVYNEHHGLSNMGFGRGILTGAAAMAGGRVVGAAAKVTSVAMKTIGGVAKGARAIPSMMAGGGAGGKAAAATLNALRRRLGR